MKKYIVEATLPVKIEIFATSGADAELRALEKIAKQFGVCADMICIENVTRIERG